MFQDRALLPEAFNGKTEKNSNKNVRQHTIFNPINYVINLKIVCWREFLLKILINTHDAYEYDDRKKN
jgi:hypothetical protein